MLKHPVNKSSASGQRAQSGVFRPRKVQSSKSRCSRPRGAPQIPSITLTLKPCPFGHVAELCQTRVAWTEQRA
jgi:hypothetical protein